MGVMDMLHALETVLRKSISKYVLPICEWLECSLPGCTGPEMGSAAPRSDLAASSSKAASPSPELLIVFAGTATHDCVAALPEWGQNCRPIFL